MGDHYGGFLCASVCPDGIRRDTRAISVRSCASAAVWAIPVHLFFASRAAVRTGAGLVFLCLRACGPWRQ